MTAVWPDPRTELQSQRIREITARLLVETDPEKLCALIAQLTRIVAQIRGPNPLAPTGLRVRSDGARLSI
jgi:hypothetical protein